VKLSAATAAAAARSGAGAGSGSGSGSNGAADDDAAADTVDAEAADAAEEAAGGGGEGDEGDDDETSGLAAVAETAAAHRPRRGLKRTAEEARTFYDSAGVPFGHRFNKRQRLSASGARSLSSSQNCSLLLTSACAAAITEATLYDSDLRG
jgi:hypothetical protein